VLVPWLRGFGPTRFLDAATPRSGQQAALGADVRDFMDALSIRSAILAGYDWGGRAACVVAALWPERVGGLVSIGGYGIQDIAASGRPAAAEQEFRYWYQWYFHTDRGRAGLTANRADIARFLWRLWSPNWAFDEATFQATADSFGNPDFVDVTIQSYRHRYGNAAGDPAYDALEAALAGQPAIPVPTIVLHGEADGVGSPASSIPRDRLFTGEMTRHLIPRAGHFLPRENPDDVVAAVVRLAGPRA
jgi:pimeloyl-ACP methyl ester carboxylesterase